MTRLPRSICVMLAVLWFPVVGISGEPRTAGKQPTGKVEVPSPNAESGSSSKVNPVEQPAQKNVQSRGLFSKKKKKKRGGGGGAHTEPPGQHDLKSNDAPASSR